MRDLPQGLLLNLFCQVLEIVQFFRCVHVELLKAGSEFCYLVLSELFRLVLAFANLLLDVVDGLKSSQ